MQYLRSTVAKVHLTSLYHSIGASDRNVAFSASTPVPEPAFSSRSLHARVYEEISSTEGMQTAHFHESKFCNELYEA